MKALSPFKGIDIYLLDQLLKGRLTPEMKVLDAGCGGGRNIRWLLQEGYDVTAIDINAAAIGQLKADFPAHKEGMLVSRIEDFHTTLTYNFILCNAVLHFAERHSQFEAMFGRLVELLAPDGLLFIRMTSSIGLEDRLGPGAQGVYDLPDGSRRYLLSRSQVDQLLRAHGLRLIEPVKTVFVDGLRSMTTLVLGKARA